MSEANNRPAPDALDLATDMLRDAPLPAGPPAELTAATIAAIRNRLAGTVPAEALARKRRRRIMSYIGFSTVTAAAVAIAIVLSPARSDAGMFEQAIENAKKAKSFRAKITQQLDKDTKFDVMLMSQAGKVRIEMDLGGKIGPMVMLADFPKKSGLTLSKNFKTATWMEDPTESLGLPAGVTKRLASADVPTMADMLGELKGAKFDKLPDEVVENRKTKVFIVKGFKWPGDPDEYDFALWIDPKTETILKFKIEMMTGNAKGMSIEGLVLDWNEKLDEQKFELKIPEGYKEAGKEDKE